MDSGAAEDIRSTFPPPHSRASFLGLQVDDAGFPLTTYRLQQTNPQQAAAQDAPHLHFGGFFGIKKFWVIHRDSSSI